jgi:predicted site-specific integrase-resolvase
MLTVGRAAEKLGRAVKTLQRWDRAGILQAGRTSTGRRYYEQAQIDAFLGKKTPKRDRVCLAYCRVSSRAQRPDLKNQREVITQFCVARGLANAEYIEEIGGGLNFKRPQFVELVDRICAGDVSTLVVAHKDRLARFGFDLLRHLCEAHQCELLVINDEKLSPEREMVEDLMTIVHCFSSRLYGLRNYKKALKEALKSQ